MTIAAVILAAGASRRLGNPKQLVLINGERLLERAVRVAVEAGCKPLVILGFQAAEIAAQCSLRNAEIILNPDWEQGMGTSIRAGIQAAQGSGAAIVMTCDQPAVTAHHLKALIAAAANGEIVASGYAGRPGVPAYFPESCFPPLLELNEDTGARDLLRDARTVNLPNGQMDVDTPEALQLATAWARAAG